MKIMSRAAYYGTREINRIRNCFLFSVFCLC